MHNAERGLFELRQGRPLLIAPDFPSDDGCGDDLVRSVEGLDDGSLERLRALAPGPLRLVVTSHRVAAMGLVNGSDRAGSSDDGGAVYALRLQGGMDAETILQLASGRPPTFMGAGWELESARPGEAAALSLARLGRLLPALLSVPVGPERSGPLQDALDRQVVLRADPTEVQAYASTAGAEVVRLSEAPVPLAEAEDSTFILFREASGLQEHVAILVGRREEWPDPVPVRLHSACLTGDLFGSLRCDCGDQLRGSMRHFAARGGGILLYLAQEGRGIGLRNKFRAYTLQEGGLDTIDADGTLGFGADERRYDVAVRILERIGVRRVELLTNNPEKLKAMEEAGIRVVVRRPLHGNLNRHNLPYVRAKVKRAGHWLGDMLSQPLSGD